MPTCCIDRHEMSVTLRRRVKRGVMLMPIRRRWINCVGSWRGVAAERDFSKASMDVLREGREIKFGVDADKKLDAQALFDAGQRCPLVVIPMRG